MSWWQLLDVISDRREEFAFYADNAPTACPNDGEPLRQAPAGSPGAELFCPFDGWQYPRDWHRPVQL